MAHNGPEIKNPGLSPRRQSALPILAAAPSIAQAARLSKVGRRSGCTYLGTEGSRVGAKNLSPLPPRRHRRAKNCLQSLAFQAVVCLGDLLENPNPEIRLRAIRAILNYSTKFGEIRDLHDQVQALEAALPLWTAQRKPR